MSTSSSASRALFLFRRAYSSAAAENVKILPPVMRAAAENKVESSLGRDVFWMKDLKTGDWLPETHFNQVDPAELRAKVRGGAATSS